MATRLALHLKVFWVAADLTANFNLHDFPFDSQTLGFTIEDELLGSDALVYEVDRERTEVSPDLLVAGWETDRHRQARTGERYYTIFDQSYSRYMFAITIERTAQYSILKNLLPGVIIVVTGLLGLLIATRFMLERLTITASALVGAILFHLQVTQNIPPLPYLTFADRFMLINYVTLALTLASTVALMVLKLRRRNAAARIYTVSLVAIPPIWLVLLLVIAVTI